MNDIKKQLYPFIEENAGIIDDIDASEYEDYKFSEEYKKKKEFLIRNFDKPYYPLIKTTKRKVIFILASAAIIGTVSVAAYAPAREYVINKFSGHSRITTEINSDEDPKTIQKAYSVIVPYDYKIDNEQSVYTDDYRSTVYYSERDNQYLYFEQSTKAAFSADIDNEQAEPTTKTDKNGNEMIIYNNGSNISIIWEANGYMFSLNGTLNEQEMMSIYYSLK